MSSSKISLVALKKPIANTSQIDASDGAILWGDYQEEPFRIIETVKRSKTASLCIKQISNYTFGNGWNDKVFANSKANKEETFNQLLSKVALSMANFMGMALNVKYTFVDNRVVPKSIYCLPFENVRLKSPDEKGGEIEKILYNPCFGTQEFDRTETQEYYIFNPDTALKESLECKENGKEYLGQVIYYGQESEYSRFYPTPYWWTDPTGQGGGKLDMENEYLLTKLLNKELDTGFLQNVILKMVGDPDQPIADHQHRADAGESYTTVGEEFSEYINDTFSGIDGDMMMILWSSVKEQFPELEEFKSKFNYEKLKDVEATVANRISAMFLVPPILAGIMGSGAISRDDIENAVYLMWSNVRERQKIITSQFKRVVDLMPQFAGKDIEIENYNPFPESNEVPDRVWEIMTIEEKREWAKLNTNYLKNGTDND